MKTQIDTGRLVSQLPRLWKLSLQETAFMEFAFETRTVLVILYLHIIFLRDRNLYQGFSFLFQ